ncbi:MAG: lipase [Cyanobacteria bacterium CRU_2_1]|nr:lipase [Cyanobacteria bacterium RU_5_0]NJR57644.1 lipase [Cyanobacteria bacterium CRU_2_1]
MPHTTHSNPVLLVHGIDDTEIIFWKMKLHLEKQGRSVHSLNLVPCNGDVCLSVLARQVAKYVDRVFVPTQAIDLVGFSMGGIISRYYVQRLGGIRRVQRFVTIASPHNGTWAAYSRSNLGCVQMRPNSLFLENLNQDALILKQINFTSIWTPLDLIIIPANSSQLPVGKDKPVWVGGHAWMVSDTKGIEAVAEELSEPLRTPIGWAKSA